MKQLLIYQDGTKIINSHPGTTLEANAPLTQEIDLTDLSDDDFETIKGNLDNDIALNQVLAKIGQNV